MSDTERSEARGLTDEEREFQITTCQGVEITVAASDFDFEGDLAIFVDHTGRVVGTVRDPVSVFDLAVFPEERSEPGSAAPAPAAPAPGRRYVAVK